LLVACDSFRCCNAAENVVADVANAERVNSFYGIARSVVVAAAAVESFL
jgi:hypothetical protein